MHQHEIAVLDLGRKHTELRLDVRARVIVRDNEFAIGCAGLLREGIVSAECEDKKIAVQTADERAVVVRHDDVSRTLRKDLVQLFVLLCRELNIVCALRLKIRRVTVDQAVRPVTFSNDIQTVFIFDDDILQSLGCIVEKIKKVRQVIRPDSK